VCEGSKDVSNLKSSKDSAFELAPKPTRTFGNIEEWLAPSQLSTHLMTMLLKTPADFLRHQLPDRHWVDTWTGHQRSELKNLALNNLHIFAYLMCTRSLLGESIWGFHWIFLHVTLSDCSWQYAILRPQPNLPGPAKCQWIIKIGFYIYHTCLPLIFYGPNHVKSSAWRCCQHCVIKY